MSLSKRSRKAALVMMVPATGFFLASCSNAEAPVEAAVFETAEQCSAFYDKTACEAELAKASELHQQVAPKYNSTEQCESDFGAGNCQQAQSSSGFFMPMMMGFLAGQLMGKTAAAKQQVPTQPLYRAKDDAGTFRTGANQPVARQTGPVQVAPGRMMLQPGQQVQRGGFGKQAQVRSQHVKSSYGG